MSPAEIRRREIRKERKRASDRLALQLYEASNRPARNRARMIHQRKLRAQAREKVAQAASLAVTLQSTGTNSNG